MTYVFYQSPIEAAITIIGIAGFDNTHIGSGSTDVFRNMAWFQWAPSAANTGIHTDAVGDWVCHGGVGSDRLRCGTLNQRFHFQNTGAEDVFGFNTWFWEQRRSSADACHRDSGGTVYRTSDLTLTGLVSIAFGAESGGCFTNMQYSHTGHLPGIGLTAPVTMF